jgi:predicted nuclease with RNAse H fold
MSEILIAGVDFSGSKTVPNDTWLTIGKIGSLGLEVMDVRKVGAHALGKELSENKTLQAVGIDVPFSLPIEFLEFMAAKTLRPNYQSWQEVAEQLVFMSFEDFQALVVEFKKEPKRHCDKVLASPAQSPLHRGYPTMVQMTFQGIRLLATIDPKRFYVLPFQSEIPFGCAVIEVYPRETLRYFNLPNTNYKAKEKKDLEKALVVRKQITEGLVAIREKKGLTYKDFPRFSMPKRFDHLINESDHALDSVIACYATAIWKTAPQLFADPLDSDNLDVLLEGWIYAPKPLA